MSCGHKKWFAVPATDHQLVFLLAVLVARLVNPLPQSPSPQLQSYAMLRCYIVLHLSKSLAITGHRPSALCSAVQLLVETFPFLCPEDDVFDRQHFRFRHG